MLKGFYVTDTTEHILPQGAVNLIESDKYGIREVDGLGRPDAEMYTNSIAGADASFYIGQTVKSRTITLSVDAQNDFYRMELYKLFGYGKKKRIFLETNTGTYWIDAYAKGMTYATKPAIRTEFEIPIFCPYPWFRSVKCHEKQLKTNEQVTIHDCSHSGDICAGLQLRSALYVDVLVEQISMENRNNAVSFDTRVATFGEEIVLLDTTPGEHVFAGGWRMTPPSNSKITGAMPTLLPYESQNIIIYVNSAGSYEEDVCFLRWYDTWSGV